MVPITTFFRLFVSLLLLSSVASTSKVWLPESDRRLLEFPLNLEYLEAEFYLYGSIGKGLDAIQPNLTGGGPPPIGVKKANLSPLVRDIIAQFGYQEVGHVRAIKRKVGGFARPLLNLSAEAFAAVINNAFERPLYPIFNPYANSINYLIASYVIPYVGLTGYVGTNPKLLSPTAKKLLAGLLGIESGQDAVIRTLLYERKAQRVIPYGITVAEFTVRISELRNRLGRAGLKDEGLIVPVYLGAEGKVTGNILAGNRSSLSYGRTPREVLRIVYQTGKEQVPGGFFPCGANGTIARQYLHSRNS
uniref:desiccation-related protein PCC13-62-like n=1 Tax=Erigeron canadensis TaxID=72917 RepID=UPI001CB891C1|nr:desiccation-related protein PCC13-62-like [Erigeron canadensis]